MSLMISCPSCKARLKAPENLIGKTVKCPQCQTTIAVKAPADSPAAAPPRQPVKPPRKPEPEPEENFGDLDERPARKPVRKPRDEDEDLAEAPPPRKGKKRDVDDFAEAPPKKGKGRAAADDFEDMDDDQPRKGKKDKTAGIPTARVTEEDKTAAFNMYLYYLISAFVCGCAAPFVFLYMWTSKRKESELVNYHGKQIINGWITGIMVGIIVAIIQCGGGLAAAAIDSSGILSLVVQGLAGLVSFGYGIALLVVLIMSMMKAKQGIYYRWPIVLHLLK